MIERRESRRSRRREIALSPREAIGLAAIGLVSLAIVGSTSSDADLVERLDAIDARLASISRDSSVADRLARVDGRLDSLEPRLDYLVASTPSGSIAERLDDLDDRLDYLVEASPTESDIDYLAERVSAIVVSAIVVEALASVEPIVVVDRVEVDAPREVYLVELGGLSGELSALVADESIDRLALGDRLIEAIVSRLVDAGATPSRADELGASIGERVGEALGLDSTIYRGLDG